MKRFIHVLIIKALVQLEDKLDSILDDLIFKLTMKLDDIFTGEKV